MAQIPDPFVEVGTVFQDRYEILGKLSQGAFGVVYKARQLSTGQHVAVKCLLRRGRDPDEDRRRVARFRREMQLCARLRHPNIVRLIDSGQLSDRLLYSVFEYVPGKTLAQVLTDDRRLSLADTRYLMSQVLDALSSAHGRGIVHRDLKPSNLMIVPTGARRNAMVLDFGIGAITRDARLEGYLELTGTLERVGTPAYAAPEQLRGKSATPRSDLYSWGLVFIECLTGQRVFGGDSVADVIHRQLEPDPVSIPAALVGHPLEKLLRLVTVKDVSLRRISAKALLEMLEACDLGAIDQTQLAGQVAMQEPSSATTLTIGALASAGASAGDMRVRCETTMPTLSEGERRQITVVACALDVVPEAPERGDTGLGEILDAELRLCVDMARQRASHVVCEPEGKVLFYVGYPLAHADDARRAVRAALEIAAAVHARNLELAATRGGARVIVRVAVHTDLTVVRKHGQRIDVTGGLGALARDMAVLARPDTVVVGATTHRLIRHHFVCSARRLAPIRAGKHAEVFEVLRTVPGVDASTSSLLEPLAPIIGRDGELELLVRGFRQAGEGQGQGVLLTSEAGMGKSRLLRELAARVYGTRHRWLECRCLAEHARAALLPIGELLERILAYPRTPAAAERGLSTLLASYGLPVSELMPVLGPLVGIAAPAERDASISSERQRQRVMGAILTLLSAMAEREPLIVVVEDVQWADMATRELIGYLLTEAPSARVLVILTAPGDFECPWRVPDLVHVQLPRLDARGVAALIVRITEGMPLPAEVVDEIVRRADGVPLYVEELTRAVLDSNALRWENGRYVLIGSLADLEIPATLRDSLMARLDRLGGAKTIAQIAATIGREVSLEQLCAVTNLDIPVVRAAMDGLVAAELVHRRRRMDGETYYFRHTLVHEAAYDSLPERTRREYHELIARVFEERFADQMAIRPELVVRHYAGAGNLVRALEYLHRAGMRALAGAAGAEALEHAREALRLCAGLADPRERVSRELGAYSILLPALWTTRGYGGAEFAAATARAQELVARAVDSPYALAVLRGVYIGHTVHGRYREAAGVGERYLAKAEQSGEAMHRLFGLGMLGTVAMYTGRLAEASAHLERALGLAALVDPVRSRLSIGVDMRVSVSSLLAVVAWLRGDLARARALAEEVLELARVMEHAPSQILALHHQAQIACHGGDREGARPVVEELCRLAERHSRLWLGRAWILKSWVTGDLALAHRALAAIETSGESYARTRDRAILAEVALMQGDWDQAMINLASGLEYAERTGERFVEPQLQRLLGECLVRSGRVAEAEVCLDQAAALAREQGARLLELEALTALCRLGLERAGAADAAGADAAVRLRALYREVAEEPAIKPLREAATVLAQLETAGD